MPDGNARGRGCGGGPGKRGFRRTDRELRHPTAGHPGLPRKKGSSRRAGPTTPNGVNFNLLKAPPNSPKPVQGSSGPRWVRQSTGWGDESTRRLDRCSARAWWGSMRRSLAPSKRVIVSRVRPRGSAQEGRGLVGFSCGRPLASACHRVSEGSVAICEEKPLTSLLVGAHTLGAHSAERYGRRSGRLNRLGGEPSCGFNKSLRCSFRRKPQGEEHRNSEACSARHRGRARSRSAEAISSLSALKDCRHAFGGSAAPGAL